MATLYWKAWVTDPGHQMLPLARKRIFLNGEGEPACVDKNGKPMAARFDTILVIMEPPKADTDGDDELLNNDVIAGEDVWKQAMETAEARAQVSQSLPTHLSRTDQLLRCRSFWPSCRRRRASCRRRRASCRRRRASCKRRRASWRRQRTRRRQRMSCESWRTITEGRTCCTRRARWVTLQW